MIADEPSSPTLWRRVIWWIWCAITRPVRPLIFLMLIGAGFVFGWQGAHDYSIQTGWSPQTAQLSGRIDQAFEAALPETDTVSIWQAELDSALDPVQVGRPDILLARSLALSLERITGQTELGLHVLGKAYPGQDREPVLRAQPAWQRYRTLDRAISDRLIDAQRRELDPAGMIFADATVRERYTRAERLFGRSVEGAEGWFIDPDNRTLGLHTLPGWQTRLEQDVWLGRDIDTLINQACGLTFMGLGEHIEGCFDPGVEPVSDPDLVLWQWTLLAYGLDSGQMNAPEGAAAGARLLAALRFADLMPVGLKMSPDRALINRALVTGAPLLDDAQQALEQPNRFTDQGAELANLAFEGQHARQIIALAADVATLRRQVGAVNALRLLSYSRDRHDVRRLVDISDEIGVETIALFHLHRDNPVEVFSLTDPFPPIQGEALRKIHLSIGFFTLSLMMIFLSNGWAWWEAGKVRKGLIKRIARGAESLILGRKV